MGKLNISMGKISISKDIFILSCKKSISLIVLLNKWREIL